MHIIDRLKKGINAYIKNDAKAAAIASIVTNKDYSAQDLLNTSGFEKAILGVMPLLNNKQIIYESNSLSDAIYKVIKYYSSGKILYILCGPSSTGKDTLASHAKHNLYINRLIISYIDKYTTRPRRGIEGISISASHAEPSGNYQYFKDKDEMKKEKNDLALSYSIDGHYYAFSGNHLLSNDLEDKTLVCIYGRFENIHDIRSKVFFKYKRIPFSILITAPSDDLEGRILRRHSISESEQAIKIKDMKRQVDFLRNNEDLITSGFDLIIENGDNNSVFLSQQRLTEFFYHTMALVNKALADES